MVSGLLELCQDNRPTFLYERWPCPRLADAGQPSPALGWPVVRQEDQRSRADPEGGDLRPESVEGPDPLRPKHLLVVAAVAVEVRRAEVEVFQRAERWRHQILPRSATVRSFRTLPV